MKKYYVTVYREYKLEVEADSIEDAFERADEMVDKDGRLYEQSSDTEWTHG